MRSVCGGQGINVCEHLMFFGHIRFPLVRYLWPIVYIWVGPC